MYWSSAPRPAGPGATTSPNVCTKLGAPELSFASHASDKPEAASSVGRGARGSRPAPRAPGPGPHAPLASPWSRCPGHPVSPFLSGPHPTPGIFKDTSSISSTPYLAEVRQPGHDWQAGRPPPPPDPAHSAVAPLRCGACRLEAGRRATGCCARRPGLSARRRRPARRTVQPPRRCSPASAASRPA